MTDWLRFDDALRKISAALPCEPTAAIYRLAKAVRNGHVQTRLPNGDTIPHNVWRVPENGRGLETESGQHIVEVEINHAELVKWLKSHEPRIGRRSGRKTNPEYDWVKARAHMAAFVAAEGGLPAKKSSMINHMKEWFKETIGKEVDRGTIRPYVDEFYDAYHDETGGP